MKLSLNKAKQNTTRQREKGVQECVRNSPEIKIFDCKIDFLENYQCYDFGSCKKLFLSDINSLMEVE